MSPRRLYGRLALAEMITWALLLGGILLKRVGGIEQATSVVGGIHGFVFLCYVVTTVAVWIDKRWSVGVGLVGLASSIVPFCTFPFERYADRHGLLEGPWRLGPGGETPRGPADRALAFALRRPLVAVVVALLVVAAVFTLLLQAGPPTQWFG